MSDAFFEPAGPGRYVPTGHVVGPWSLDHMHAGPPSALLAHAIGAATRDGAVPSPALMSRFSVEILKPVPVEPVEVEVEVERAGRRVALVVARLLVAGEVLLHATGWLMRQEPVDVPPTRHEPAPGPGVLAPMPPVGWNSGYLDSVEWSWVEGAFGQPGPATAWTRSLHPLVAGQDLAPLERVLLVADSGSGLSAVASPDELIFVNTELTVHLTRPPRGERVWMRSETFLDRDGVGLATTVLGDEDGRIGVGNQSLFLASVPGRH